MSFLHLPEPDWQALPGGTGQEAKWIADRDRKFSLMMESVERFAALSADLHGSGDLVKCSPRVLRTRPEAVDWYISAAGYALNTLQYIRDAPKSFGVTKRVRTIRDRLLSGLQVSDDELASFSSWINAELTSLYGRREIDLTQVRGIAFGVLGARAVGRGQNIGGDDGVHLLRRLIVSRARDLGIAIWMDVNGYFVRDDHPGLPEDVPRIRLGNNIVCDFSGGGGRADVRVMDRRVVLALGEVKARKDVSNVWESWMPQVVDHMRTWAGDSPDASRLFFGTLITDDMLSGMSSGGVRRAGLRTLYNNGMLTSAYNLSKIAAGVTDASKDFDILMNQLAQRVAQ